MSRQPLWPKVGDAEGRQVEQRAVKPVAAMTSSASTSRLAAPSEARVRTRSSRPRRSMRVDRGIEDEDAAAHEAVLDRLDVARADAGQRVRVDRQLGRPRRGEHDPAGPRQEAAGQLEAGVLLADDEQPLAGVGLRGARGDVVGDVLAAGRSRASRARRHRRRRRRDGCGSRRRWCARTKPSPSARVACQLQP